MKEYGEILLGLALAIAGVGMLVIPQVAFFRDALVTVILGVVPIIVLLLGAVFLMIGISDVRERGEEGIEMEATEAEAAESTGTGSESEKGEGD
ncbi:MAG: hypothetical protein KAU16_05265 [Methanophagales archaeon]|nr:hypothetical protein [Methanophagales archaeon]